MKFTIERLLEINQVLAGLFQKELSAKLQYYVARNLAKIGEELKTYEETRYSLGEKYGEINEEKKIFEFPDEDLAEKFKEEFLDLVGTEVTVPLSPLKLGWLDGLEMTGPQMLVLSDIIEE